MLTGHVILGAYIVCVIVGIPAFAWWVSNRIVRRAQLARLQMMREMHGKEGL